MIYYIHWGWEETNELEQNSIHSNLIFQINSTKCVLGFWQNDTRMTLE